MTWRVIFAGVVSAILASGSFNTLRAATSHQARTCGQTDCSGWDIQTATPTSADPLYASVVNFVAGGGSTACIWPATMSIVNWGEVTVARPFDVVGEFETLNCQGGGNQDDTTIFADYVAQDIPFYFTRTDQPAAPSETVQVRLNTEWRGHTIATFNTATIDISYSLDEMRFAGSLPYSVFLLTVPGLQSSPLSVGSGNWNTTPTFMPFQTVTLDTPQVLTATARISAREKVDNNHVGGITRYESVTSVGLRLAQRPFSFNGPGTYTVHAPSLNIYDNYWPVMAVIDENTTQPELDDLTEVDGSIIVEAAPGIGCLSFTNMTQVTGSMIVQGGPSYDVCLELVNAWLEEDFTVSSHTGDLTATLGDVGGDVEVENSEGDVELVIEGDVTGDIVVSEPGAAARGSTVAAAGAEHTVSVTLNGAAVGGRVALTGVGPTTLAIPGAFSIGGDLEGDNIAQSALDLSQTSVGGSAYLRTRDTASIDISTAALDTRVIADHTTDALDLTIPSGAVAAGTSLSLNRLGGAELPWQAGVKPGGGSGALDPLAMFAVDVGAGSLAQPATLALELDLTGLSPAERAALNQVVGDGRLTVARRSTGGPLQSLPLCPTDEPALSCAALRALDGAGLPTTIELASSVKLSTLTADFSDWALVVVSNGEEIPAMSEWGLAVFGLLVLTAGTVSRMRGTRPRATGSNLP